MKILVIDDDQAIRQFLRDLLLSAGYEVECAADGEEGLRKALAETPRLVVTDVLMPRMDGFQLLRTIRKNSALKDVAVIFYTGSYLDQEDRRLAGELGVSEYLEKPLDADKILQAVRSVLDRSGAGQTPGRPAGIEEPVFLKLYNERLVNKLKGKMVESERARLALEHIMESMGDGVVVIDLDYRITQANSAAAEFHGVDRADMIGVTCYEMFHRRHQPCEGPHVTCPFDRIFGRRAQTVKVIHTHTNAQGDERQVEITASAVRDGSGEVIAVVESHRDIMDNKTEDELVKLVKRLNETQTHLKHMAITDELTGLRNRRYIVERLEEEYLRARRTNRPLGLIMLDIDHFKQINDRHGHLFGDVVLRVIAARMRSMIRKHDLIGRVGGEEFLIVCPESSLEETLIVAERVRKSVNEDMISDGVDEVRVALSAGVTMQTADDASSDRLFSRADTALYRAKEEGRNKVVVL